MTGQTGDQRAFLDPGAGGEQSRAKTGTNATPHHEPSSSARPAKYGTAPL